jgi:hypothetical protein
VPTLQVGCLLLAPRTNYACAVTVHHPSSERFYTSGNARHRLMKRTCIALLTASVHHGSGAVYKREFMCCLGALRSGALHTPIDISVGTLRRPDRETRDLTRRKIAHVCTAGESLVTWL